MTLILETIVFGDYAFLWGTYRYGMLPAGGGETIRTHGKIVRVLQRQPDRTWKIHRGMMTGD
jgi:ketosteroid isomerase-like protein